MPARPLMLTGFRSYHLRAVKRVYPNSERNWARWLCQCDCGKQRIVEATQLRHRRVRSCGCEAAAPTGGPKSEWIKRWGPKS